MLNVVLCEDNPLHLKYSQKLIMSALAEHDVCLDAYESAEALMKVMQYGDYRPDIAVLDIDLGEMNGIELAKRLNELAPDCRIIFLSGHLSYAPEVYETEHVYFVLKDKAQEHIADALGKALASLDAVKSRPKSITARLSGGTLVIPASTIDYLELYNRRTRIVTESGEYISSGYPEELAGGLNDMFVRCHQSFWVNISRAVQMTSSEFGMADGKTVPIGRAYRQRAKEAFFEFLKAD